MTASARSWVRCAIYTRKSSEEGLEQSFNSLQAQREACEAYIASQRHEGWQVVAKKYDDGGFSGGNMNRPGLKQLLDDIAARLVDTWPAMIVLLWSSRTGFVNPNVFMLSAI
jgi:DNA invertase Pin-like site-specific DNA recombinase